MKNIVLIGMPGVGKSTVGVILAKMIGYHFVDTDILIQEQENRLLCDIIESDGVEGFLKIENKINSNINITDSVIATGGSVIYGKEAMEHLGEIGTIIYLKLPYNILDERLENIKGIGVVLKDGQGLHDIYEERIPLYEKYADIVIDEEGLSVEETIEKILEVLNKK